MSRRRTKSRRRAAGADGCKGGWICITREGLGRITSACFESAEQLVSQRPQPDVLAIDIPIGLPERGARQCDLEARALLGARRNSVFPAPLRRVLRANSWQEACDIREHIEDRRMSRQAWGIVPKIRDVDTALRQKPERSRWIREVHPELSFRAWSGAPMRHGKKTRAGRDVRLALVTRHFGSSAFGEARERHARSVVSDDDLLDAFAALFSAERILRGEAVELPSVPPRDRTGLRMEIVY